MPIHGLSILRAQRAYGFGKTVRHPQSFVRFAWLPIKMGALMQSRLRPCVLWAGETTIIPTMNLSRSHSIVDSLHQEPLISPALVCATTRVIYSIFQVALFFTMGLRLKFFRGRALTRALNSIGGRAMACGMTWATVLVE